MLFSFNCSAIWFERLFSSLRAFIQLNLIIKFYANEALTVLSQEYIDISWLEYSAISFLWRHFRTVSLIMWLLLWNDYIWSVWKFGSATKQIIPFFFAFVLIFFSSFKLIRNQTHDIMSRTRLCHLFYAPGIVTRKDLLTRKK